MTVRYRDCPTVEVEERIAADPAAIWALVTDIDLPARFSDELQAVEWIGGAAGVAVGNRFRGRNQNSIIGTGRPNARSSRSNPGVAGCGRSTGRTG